MKKIVLWSIVTLAVVMGAAIYFAFQYGDVSPVYAAGDVALSEALVPEAKGIRTLYITVFNMESPMPMPYGAMVEYLSEDIATGGKFLAFMLTKERLRVMNPDLPPPQKLRIKARLDRDGMGGMDQSGDLVGEITNVNFGQRDVLITIDKKVE